MGQLQRFGASAPSSLQQQQHASERFRDLCESAMDLLSFMRPCEGAGGEDQRAFNLTKGELRCSRVALVELQQNLGWAHLGQNNVSILEIFIRVALTVVLKGEQIVSPVRFL